MAHVRREMVSNLPTTTASNEMSEQIPESPMMRDTPSEL